MIKDKRFTLKNYWSPTPKSMRKLGDAMVAATAIIATGGAWQYDTLRDVFTPKEIRWAIAITIAACAIGKFLTNFFKDNEEEKKP
ncbi:MAG: hypothetical protein ABI241_00425 [Bacteroidia bacterium]